MSLIINPPFIADVYYQLMPGMPPPTGLVSGRLYCNGTGSQFQTGWRLITVAGVCKPWGNPPTAPTFAATPAEEVFPYQPAYANVDLTNDSFEFVSYPGADPTNPSNWVLWGDGLNSSDPNLLPRNTLCLWFGYVEIANPSSSPTWVREFKDFLGKLRF